MFGPQRSGAPAKKQPMRPPPRPLSSRTQSAAATLANGRVSPAESLVSNRNNSNTLRSPPTTAGAKRKERDFDQDGGEETNITVVVRCRGRSDREVRENSGVVVSTDGVKGKVVELSMGPNAVSNKTYNFDRVFSPAADQGMVFQEVVAPIVEEVLAGFNCTIFAYGQTGTGKTYTMSGDITDMPPLPDDAGIIPRVLFSLFDQLESDEQDHCVKCSFIELYNEELRDLISNDENQRLKIFDDASRKSHTATLVQGMEETHIESASKGVDLLREGNRKRQVAATKCNDLSSRSHTVFTITVYTKKAVDGGEDFVSAGKLNLVDLAGSENIQRSGAENKRAAEAGLINKSLLTLGRVINALVDKSPHIPYRESKLTRLLQDSLGGRTKTCIIATLSPSKSNLEETISTLDYAFRAKNIRNKPQTNQLISKKTLFREFSIEIEKLKSELIATRHRNGVYLSVGDYEEMTTESESRRILSEEQRDKIDTMETNLRNKAQELFSLTTTFSNLKRDNEAIKAVLDGKQDVLEKTESVLTHTREELLEESTLRKAHEDTEGKLITIGKDLIRTLGKTTTDIGGLQSKLRRRSDLQSQNRTNWSTHQTQLAEQSTMIQERLQQCQKQHGEALSSLSQTLNTYLQQEKTSLGDTRTFLQEKTASLDQAERQTNELTNGSRNDMNEVLKQVNALREGVKQNISEGLNALSGAAERISAGVIGELEAFHTQLHGSYTTLGKEFKTVFDDLSKRLQSQQEEIQELRNTISSTNRTLTESNAEASEKLEAVKQEEREHAKKQRSNLIASMTSLIEKFGEAQEERIESKFEGLRQQLESSMDKFGSESASNNDKMESLSKANDSILEDLLKSRETVKRKIKNDWSFANKSTTDIQTATRSIHDETVKVAETQMMDVDSQLQSLDRILSKVQDQSDQNHDVYIKSIKSLATPIQESYSEIQERVAASAELCSTFENDFESKLTEVRSALEPLEEEVCGSLAIMRSEISAATLVEYIPTGETPPRTQYSYPSSLPRTEQHTKLLHRLHHPNSPTSSESRDLHDLAELNASPSKARVFTDVDSGTIGDEQQRASSSPEAVRNNTRSESVSSGLRELDVNVAAPSLRPESAHSTHSSSEARGTKRAVEVDTVLQSKKQNTGALLVTETKNFSASLGSKAGRKAVVAAGRENLPLSGSIGPGAARASRRRLS